MEAKSAEGSDVFSGNQVDSTSPVIRHDTEVLSVGKKSGIRVEVTSSGAAQRNTRQENMKTISAVREYSLEDGGIFEKKTIIANTSMEDPVKHEDFSQRSFELL